jgi:hypothetical protein
MKIVYIKWGDAWVDGSKDFTETEAELFEPITRTTVGYYVTENHNCLVLATDYYDEEKSYNCPMVIPKAWIFSIHYVEIADLNNEDTTH